MEVGAVKQAFNNEVIHLKQKLNQARIQVIHKLTRKAKTLMEKKAPEKLKEKHKRKAELAVKEVLILKKIKPKDLAKFTVTHTGDLKTYLNRPNIDIEKACARLLLHKALHDKYSHIRNRYSNMPIEDLLMSRLERRRLKKEEKDKQKDKKKEKQNRTKNNSICSEGDWTVEDVKTDSKTNLHINKDVDDEENNDEALSDESELTEADDDDDEVDGSGKDRINDDKSEVTDDDAGENSHGEEVASKSSEEDDEDVNSADNSDDDNEAGDNESNDTTSFPAEMPPIEQLEKTKINNIKKVIATKPPKEDNRAKLPKINKDKNKKQLVKITSKKFKKDIDETAPQANFVVDPFFITSTGDRYMSVAEPREPDEVKEVHKQGNRKLRRAVMFGHELKTRPRPYNDRRNNNNGFNRNERFDNSGSFDRNKNNFNRNERNNFDRRDVNKFDRHNNSSDFDNKKFNSFERKPDFKSNNFKTNFKEEKSSVPEKLHPSWEAKKKISSILPYQGKKITFD